MMEEKIIIDYEMIIAAKSGSMQALGRTPRYGTF